MTAYALLTLLLGVVLLLFGRRAFWIFVAAVGFVAGLTFATEFMRGQPELVILLIGILGGIAGAVLSIALEWLAILIAGFLAGGYLATALATTLGLSLSVSPSYAAVYIVGGIIGLILIAALFDWAIILLSVLIGAEIIMPFMSVSPEAYWLIFAGLIVIGVVVQVGLWRRNYPVQRTGWRRHSPQAA